MQNQARSNGVFASFYFCPGEPDELLYEFMTLTGPTDASHATSLKTFDCKIKKPLYAIGCGESDDGYLEVFGPLPYAIVKRHSVEVLREKLMGTITFLHLKRIDPYSAIAESAMKRMDLDTEGKVQEYLKTLNLKSIPILNARLE